MNVSVLVPDDDAAEVATVCDVMQVIGVKVIGAPLATIPPVPLLRVTEVAVTPVTNVPLAMLVPLTTCPIETPVVSFAGDPKP